MFPQKRFSIILLFPLMLAACATFTASDGEKATYYESSFNDKNRAPANFAPVSFSQDGSQMVDTFYMRTQADYYFSMGEALSLEGKTDKAIEAFKMTLIYDQESPAVHMRLAAEYLKQGLVSESLEQADSAVKKDPKNVEARLLLGGLYSSIKNYTKAMNEYQTVMKIQPDNIEAPLYIGALYSEEKQSEKAVKYFESLLKKPEYNTPHLVHYYIGRVRAEQEGQKYEKAAEAAFKKSLQIKPDFVDSVLALGALYSKNKQEAKALALYREFQKGNSPSARVAEILSQSLIDRGEYEEAYQQMEIAESESDEPLNLKVKMALLLIEQKKYEAAIAKLGDVLKEVPDSDKVRFYLAAVHEEIKQSEQAIKEYKKVPVTSSYYGESVVHSAYLLKGLGRLQEAIEEAALGLKNRKDYPPIYAIYASLLDENNDFKAASEILASGLEKFPENAQLLFYYGTMNDRLGNKEVVISQMKKVIEIDPNHVQGLNYLAFTWAEMGMHLPEAEKLARRALQIEPKDGYILDTLGWILYKQSKFSESIKMLEAAHIYQSKVSIIAEHLGDAYYKHSLVEKARTMYKKAADLETDQKKLQEIRSKIFAIEKQELLTPTRLPASAEEKPLAERGR